MLKLGRFINVEFDEWLTGAELASKRHTFVVVSGYERRSTAWARRVISKHPTLTDRFIVFGFPEFSDHPIRKENDSFYKSVGVPVTKVSATDPGTFVHSVTERCESQKSGSGSEGVEVHVD